MKKSLLFCALILNLTLFGKVRVGLDTFFEEGYAQKLHGKRVGLITNHTALDGAMMSAHERFSGTKEFELAALFAPEHGFLGIEHAGESVKGGKKGAIPIHSLHGETRRPTAAMLKGIDTLIFD